MMTRSLLASLAGAIMALPAAAAPVSLDALSQYFNDFRTAEATFSQVNSDGSISTGQLFIHRPGRVRFEYDPPDENIVVAGGGTVSVFDRKSNQGPQSYPLSRTPLNLILAREVDLTRSDMVIDHVRDDGRTVVVAQDPERPEYGTIEMVFTHDPIELRQWVITDDAGETTTVILDEFTTGVSIAARMFSLRHEIETQGSPGATR